MRRYINLLVVTLVLISLFIASIFPPQTASASPLLAVTISPTKTDAIINDGVPLSEAADGKADPGEIIEYTVVIPNSGDTDATGVTFNDIIDLNTTLVGGSLNVSPLAVDDNYDTIGNTLLEVGVTASGNPAVRVTNALIDSLLDNDIEFLGDTFTLKSVEAETTAPFTTATESGGSVIVEGDGNFSYTPSVGFSGADHFDYVLTDDGPDNILGNADDLTGAGRVTINVNTQRVWYLKNNATAGGTGRSTDPFDTLAEAQAASSANDTIYVFQGNGTTTGQNAGITLKNGQRLLGEGVALTVPITSGSFNGVQSPTTITLRAVGTRPTIGNSAGDGISLSTALMVPPGNFTGVEIRGLNISGTGAGSNAVDVTTNSTFGGSFELADNVISAAGAEGIDVNGGGTVGVLTVSIHDNTVTATGNGIDILRGAGAASVNIVAFDDNIVTGSTGGIGINIIGGGAGTVLFDTDPSTASYVGNTVSGGNTVIGLSGAGNGSGTSGMVLNNIKGDLSFTDLDIYTDNGAALSLTGTTSNFLTSGTGARVTANTGTPTLVAVGGPALTTNQTNINIVPTTFSSTNSGTTGVSLLETSGTLTAPSGSSITNATGTDFSVDGNLIATATVSVTYAGTITDDLGTLVQIVDVTGGSPTYAFTGAITDNNDGDGSGISLTNNDSATIRFSGGLLLSTGSNPAFTATSGATAVEVCDENPCNPAATGSLVNTLTSTTGTALNIANTTIGANNLEFRSISSNGATNGIVLNNTGSGGLKVKGNTSGSCGGSVTVNTVGTPATVGAPVTGDCSGGTIQTSSGHGIVLNNTDNASLTRMYILNSGLDGINALDINGFTLANSYITDNSGVAGDRGIEFGDFSTGTPINGAISVTDSRIGPTPHDNFGVGIGSGTSSWNITGTVFDDSQLNSGFNFEIRNATVSSFLIDGSVFQNHFADGMQMQPASGVSAAITLATIQNSTFTGNNIGMDLNHDGTSNVTYRVLSNTFRTHQAQPINFFSSATVGTGGTMTGRFVGNVIGNAGIANSGSTLGNGIRININGGADSTVLLDNNNIRQTPNGRGIEVISRNGTGGLDVTVTNNNVNPNDVSGFPLAAIFLQSNCVTVCNTIRADVRGNTVPVGSASGELLPTFIAVVESNTSTCQLMDNSPASANATAELTEAHTNPAHNNTGSASASAGCALIAGPISTAYSPDTNQILAQNKVESNPLANVQTSGTNLNSANTFTFAFTSLKLPEQASEIDPANTVANASVNVGGGKPIFSIKQPIPAQSETVTVPAFTLPAGKSVTIKFQVTVNDPVTLGTTQISNQGTVNGSNFSNVLTDDTTVVGGSDPTITPVDRPDANVNSINRQTPSTTSTNATSVVWRVTFNMPISGLTSSNFILANTGLTSPSITTVSAVTGAPDTQWDVTANTGSGDGTLGLNMTNDTGLSHDVFTLTFTGQTYTIDKTAPTISYFHRSNPAPSDPAHTTNADILVFEVDFSERLAAFQIAANDFASNGTTTPISNSISVVDVNAGTYLVTIDAADGGDLANLNGVVGLNFSPGVTITDQAGNAFVYAEPSPASNDQTYTLDNAVPTVTINQAVGQSDPTNASPIVFTAVFSEAVTDFDDLSDVTLGGTASATVTSITGGPTTYTVNVTATTEGTVTATVPVNKAQDSVGNNNAASTSADNTVTYDTTAPTVTINQAAGQGDPTGSSPINFTVVFNEPVTDFDDLSDITISGTASSSVNSITGGPTIYNVSVNATSNGTVIAGVGANVAQDMAGNLNTASISVDNTVSYDGTQPTVTINQAAGQSDPTGTSPINFTVVFSEAVTDFDDTSDVTLSGTAGATTVLITSGTTTYNVAVSGMTGDGTVIATIPSGVATDGVNTNAASAITDNSVLYDALPPSTTSFTRQTPSGQNTNADTLVFRATFSEDVTGVDTTDFDPSGTTATVTLVTPVSAKIYDLTVSGGDLASLNGVVAMDFNTLAPADFITDLGGNNLPKTEPSTDEIYTVDNTAPSTIDFLWQTPASSPTNADTLIFRAQFSENVTNVDTTDFAVNGTITATVTGVSFFSSGLYDVTVSGGNLAGFNGVVGLNFNTGSLDITDLAGNSLPGTEPSTDNTYTVDNITPSLTSFTLKTPATSPTNADTLVFSATFSEPVTSVDTGDFVANTTSTATVTAVSPVTTSTYDVTISGGNLADYDGTVNLNLSGTPTITDLAFNALPAGEPSTDQTYTVDNSTPSVTINQAAGQNDPTNVGPINFTVVFSEVVTDFDDAADVTLSGGTGATTILITGGPTTYKVAVSGMIGDGTVIASVSSGAAIDGASQPNTVSTSTDNTVTYDATQPAVTINQAAGQSDPASGVINFTAVFSEPVTDFDDTADVILSGGAGATTVLITGGPATYNVAVSGMTVDGTVTASIPAGVATDGVNLNTASTSTDNTVTFIADAVPPNVSSVNRADPSPSSTASVNFTVTFSESVTGVDLSDFTLTTTGVSGASVSNFSGSGANYTVTVNTGTGNGTIRLDVLDDDTIIDSASNSLSGGFTSGQVYAINKNANVEVTIGGNNVGNYDIPLQGSERPSYPGVDDGPVKVESINGFSIIAAVRNAWSQNGVVQSWVQLMGLPDTQLSTTYYFPAYNNVTLSDQLRFANLGAVPTTVTVKIGSVVNQSYVLQAGESLRVSYPGVDSGPVTVSSDGQLIIAALREAWSQNNVVESWSQLMGLPDTQLSTAYYFPAYNNVTLSDQLRFANLGNAQTTVTVKIGSVVNQSYVLQAGESLRVSYPGVDAGPVTISSDGEPIITALREAWLQNRIVESWVQLMGLPETQLSTTYYFPAYNNVTLSDQLRFANLGNAQTTVTVKIGSVVNQSYVLQAGESLRVSYPGVDSGPVTVSSDGQLIIAAVRNAWSQNGIVESWAQLMGLSASHLSDTFYFPAYNNVTLSDQLRIAVP